MVVVEVDEEDNRLVQVDMLNQAMEDMVLGSLTHTEEIVSLAVPPDPASYNKLCQSVGITPSRTQYDIFPPLCAKTSSTPPQRPPAPR